MLNVLCGESFPTEIRATSNGIVYATSYVALMANYKLYPIAVATFSFHYVVYFYAAITAALTLWGLLTISDTDKLSLTEIQNMYKNEEGKHEQRDTDSERTQDTRV